MSEETALGPRVWLGIVSLSIGVVSGIVFFQTSPEPGYLSAFLCAASVSLLYPFLAAFSVKYIDIIFRIALIFKKDHKWDLYTKTVTGLLWPFAVPICTIIGIFSSIINRLFR